MGALEEDVEREGCRNKKSSKKSKREWKMGGANGKPGAGEVRCCSRDKSGRSPRAESREGGAMVEKA